MSTTRAYRPLSSLTFSLLVLMSPLSAQGEPPTIEAVFTNSKPTLDATIGAGEWDAAEPSVIEHVLRAAETARPMPHYQFRVLWDEEALYVLFETNLSSWPGGTGGFSANNNLNFYLDPDNDEEENGAGGNMFDGYHPVLYPDDGKTSRFDRPFDPGVRAIFHEASINADFGGSGWPASTSEEEGVAIDYVSEVGATGGIIEICFPWQLFDSEEGTEMEILHPDPPEVGDSWFLNVCLGSALGDLPTWSWTPGQYFAVRPHGIMTFVANPVRAPLTVSHDAGAGTVSISWASRELQLYNLRSESDLSNGEPITWPIFGAHQDIPGTPPANTVTFPFTGDSQRFFVVEEFPAPPVSIYSDDFELGQGAWTTGVDDAIGDTQWEFGSPSVVGPTTAKSGTNCFGTNLAANYSAVSDIWLRSPPVDLTTATAASVVFSHFSDIEPMFDSGRLAVLDAADDSELAVLDASIDGGTSGWEEESYSLPPEALEKIVKFEFRFQSDDFGHFAGWYIDDVGVTTP